MERLHVICNVSVWFFVTCSVATNQIVVECICSRRKKRNRAETLGNIRGRNNPSLRVLQCKGMRRDRLDHVNCKQASVGTLGSRDATRQRVDTSIHRGRALKGTHTSVHVSRRLSERLFKLPVDVRKEDLQTEWVLMFLSYDGRR
jgi:hypothetical protein